MEQTLIRKAEILREPELCAPPLAVTAQPKHRLPTGACDCHFHIFDSPSVQVAHRSYTAPPASLAAYRQLQKTLGVQRSVIVQPSVYGADNRTTVAVCSSDPHMRAVVVVDEEVTEQDLRSFAEAGVVGCRVNMLFSSGVHSGTLDQLARRIADFGWHIQILADISTFEGLEDVASRLPVPVIFDHMGHMPAHFGVSHPAFQRFLGLLADGRIWAKLSGAYRVTACQGRAYDDVAEIVSALVAANPEQLVWGSDWPHPQIPVPMPDDTDLLTQFFDWIPNAAHQRHIFASNPALFYGF